MPLQISKLKTQSSVSEARSEGQTLKTTDVKERRYAGDRRKQSLWAHINPNPNRRRRSHHRRKIDQHNTYLDRYDPVLVYITLSVLLLSCLDATFTLALLQRGSEELNPVMAWLININPHLFVAVKLGFTGTGLILLLAHTHFRIFGAVRVVYLLYLSLGLYFLLAVYELVLLSQTLS